MTLHLVVYHRRDTGLPENISEVASDSDITDDPDTVAGEHHALNDGSKGFQPVRDIEGYICMPLGSQGRSFDPSSGMHHDEAAQPRHVFAQRPTQNARNPVERMRARRGARPTFERTAGAPLCASCLP